MSEALAKAQGAKAASVLLQEFSSTERAAAINSMADALLEHSDEILQANNLDIEAAKSEGLKESLIDRLALDAGRLQEIASNMRDIARQRDLIGQVLSGSTLANGIHIKKVSVPMGVLAMIYEARPNVTADAAALAIKTANTIVLRGGSTAKNSNLVMTKVLQDALAASGLPRECVQSIESTDRQESVELMGLSGLVDLLIPRGGAKLIQTVIEHAKVPVIETGTGNNHVYVEKSANFEMAQDIVLNAKTQRTGVCNAIENLLIDRAIAKEFLALIIPTLKEREVEIVATQEILDLAGDKHVKLATDEDFDTEYLALKISISLVDGVDEAVSHINAHGSHHSEAIVTESYKMAQTFTNKVDAACVYVNASTRFSDGAIFGLGAEIGISTQKLHARGPMGAEALISTKYICEGSGQIRG